MKTLKLLLFFVFIINNTIFSQNQSSSTPDLISFSNIRLRNSFESSQNLSPKPAELVITLPKNEKEHFLINAAFGYNFNLSRGEAKNNSLLLIISPFIEYHRNNLIEKEQNSFQAGVFLDWITQNVFTRKYTPVINAKFNYNNDVYNRNKSFFFSGYLSFVFNSKNIYKYFLPQSKLPEIGKLISYNYYPQIGIEYDNKIWVKGIDTKGFNSAAMGRILFNIYPLFENLSKKLEFQIDYSYRYNFFHNSNIYSKYLKILIFSINFIIFDDEDKSIKIGADYTNGDNPIINIFKQDVWNLTFKIKF
jgi:hypothetical protein